MSAGKKEEEEERCFFIVWGEANFDKTFVQREKSLMFDSCFSLQERGSWRGGEGKERLRESK